MAQYDEHEMYGGARVETARVPEVAMPRDVTAEMRERGAMQAWQNVANLEKEAVTANDYYVSINDSERVFKLEAQCKEEIARRMRLPDGHPDSFIDEKTGEVSQVKMRDFMKPYIDEGHTIGRGVINPELRMRVRGHAADTLNGIISWMGEEAMRVQDEKNLMAFEEAYENSMAREDYGRAAALIADAQNRGAIDWRVAMSRKRMLTRILAKKRAAAGDASNMLPKEYRGDDSDLTAFEYID